MIIKQGERRKRFKTRRNMKTQIIHGAKPMSEEQWHVFGQRASVSFDELADIGLALMGLPPKHHEWVRIREDRKAYQVGPQIAEERRS